MITKKLDFLSVREREREKQENSPKSADDFKRGEIKVVVLFLPVPTHSHTLEDKFYNGLEVENLPA